MFPRPIVGLPFLRDRWSGGKGRGAVWIRCFAGSVGFAIQAHLKSCGYAVGGTFVDAFYWPYMSYGQKEGLVMQWIKKLRRTGRGAVAAVEAKDSSWIEAYPALHEYLTCLVGEDGKPRQAATLNLFTESGSWKAWLNDRAEGASLCASGETVEGLLGALEAMLESANPPWRLRPLDEGQNGRKGKRGG